MKLAFVLLFCCFLLDHSYSFWNPIRDWVNKGNKAYQSNQLSNALENYYKAYKKNDQDSSVLFNIGNVLYKQKKYDDAISNYQRGLNYVKKEDRHLFEYNIGNSYYQKKIIKMRLILI